MLLQRDVNEKRDCEIYRRKTVDPSFDPQQTSLMLKMSFFRRSGKNMKKIAPTDTVFFECSRRLSVCIFAGFWGREIAENREKRLERME